MKDELNDSEHLEMLNNKEADLFGLKATFKDYVRIGFDIEEAKSAKNPLPHKAAKTL